MSLGVFSTRGSHRWSFLYLAMAGMVLGVFAWWVQSGMEVSAAKTRLAELRYEHLPLGEIRPAGWLKGQLRIQADGLSGHLDEFWPDIKDSGWIGGEAEGWQRAPYWLDGIVPLAFLLDDEKLKKKAKLFVDYALKHQAEDGWLGPEKSLKGNYKGRDPWPVFVMMKVLTQWEEANGDKRVVPALTKFLRTLDRQLDERPLFDWNKMRWQDGVVSVHWLYDKTGESWLLDLAEKMERQGYDWVAHFADLPHKEKVDKWEHESHVVNNAMGVKAPGVWYRQSSNDKEREMALEAIKVLDKYHGQASGVFSGDECFAGKMPSQGTETCAVVEYLYSLEILVQILGNAEFGDRMEKIAFNALPAAFKPDMWARQYVQQANQAVTKVSNDRLYTTNGSDANMYGLETNYGCCTANMHQGWPKFASHLWMKTAEEGLAAVAYGPSLVETRIKGIGVSVELSTDYPFDEVLNFQVTSESAVLFPLHLRIPGWAENATIQIAGGTMSSLETGRFHTVEREWRGTTEITLTLPMPLSTERRFNNATTIVKGPLVFSLKVGESWQHYDGQKPHATWQVFPTSRWNYALQIDGEDPQRSVTFEKREVGENPFSPEGAPIIARVKGRLLPEWTLEKNAAAPPPQSPVASDQPLEELVLIPYGAAKLRITEFPTLE